MPNDIKHIKRGIDVWQTPTVMVQLEGETLTLQIRDAKGVVSQPLVIPRTIADDLYAILAEACSVPGAVVTEVAVVPRPRPQVYDPRVQPHPGPLCAKCGGYGCQSCR